MRPETLIIRPCKSPLIRFFTPKRSGKSTTILTPIVNKSTANKFNIELNGFRKTRTRSIIIERPREFFGAISQLFGKSHASKVKGIIHAKKSTVRFKTRIPYENLIIKGASEVHSENYNGKVLNILN